MNYLGGMLGYIPTGTVAPVSAITTLRAVQRKATTMEQCGALRDVYESSLEYGDTIKVYIREEEDIRRDAYEDYKVGKTEPDIAPLTIPIFPPVPQPNRRQLEKAGIREDCEVLVYTPMYSWNLVSVDFEDIDMTRSTVVLKNTKYVIKEKGLASPFTDTHLYITLALKRK